MEVDFGINTGNQVLQYRKQRINVNNGGLAAKKPRSMISKSPCATVDITNKRSRLVKRAGAALSMRFETGVPFPINLLSRFGRAREPERPIEAFNFQPLWPKPLWPKMSSENDVYFQDKRAQTVDTKYRT